ncbi:MAG: hypothetical protein IJF76_00145 [Clostridia bacterium]|nr:hypothetical protein [Clostridia bacterium]
MEIFEDEVYERLEEGYRREEGKGGLNRAMLGVLPFRLEKGEDKKRAEKILGECYWINDKIKNAVFPYQGVAPNVVKKLLKENEEYLEKYKLEDVGYVFVGFVESAEYLVKRVESVVRLQDNTANRILLIRCYALLNLFITG